MADSSYIATISTPVYLPTYGYLIVRKYFNRKTKCVAKPGQRRFTQLSHIITGRACEKKFLILSG